MTPQFWQDKRVLLTGHTGFKGSWLSLWLQALGARVTGFALEAPSDPSLFEIAQVAEGMTSLFGDVRHPVELRAAFAQAEPEIVFHLAAQALVRRSYHEPVETYATNVMGTVHVLEAIRQTPSVRAAVMVTSDKCYEGRSEAQGYREDEPMGGHDPYASSKGCAELVVSAYRRSYWDTTTAPRVASARAGNVIGGGDWGDDRLIPDVVRATVAGTTLEIRNPDAKRPWQHVLEPLSAYLQLAEALVVKGPEFAGAWNFGPLGHGAQPVRWMVEHFIEQWRNITGSCPLKVVYGVPSSLHEASWLALDISKAADKLGWRPRLSLPHSLRLTAEWYAAHASGSGDMRGITLAQIRELWRR